MNWPSWALLALALHLTSSAAKRNFLLIGPKLFDVGTRETLILSFFNVNDTGKLHISLLNSTGDNLFEEVTTDIENGKAKTVELTVPSKIPDDTTTGRLKIVGSIGDYNINRSIAVGFRNPKPLVFISTDKPLYKAGQTVKIRVLVTDSDLLLPRGTKGEIWITDPNKIRIAQWTDTSFSQGLLHRELYLSEEPVLGTWSVHVKVGKSDHVRIFQVEEYVLPAFEVIVTPPPYVLQNQKNATWKICAKYTYGKPVRGELVTKLSLTRYYWQKEYHVIENKTEIDGCQNVVLPVDELLTNNGYYTSRGLELVAEVTEDGTGTKMNATSVVHPTNYIYTISRDERDRDTKYFRPHIPLTITMSVKTPDSKPLPDEPVKVCMETIRKKWNEARTVTDTLTTCKNYTSNQYGYVIFTIPPQDLNTMTINIEVLAAEYTKDSKNKRIHQPRDSFTLTPWFSPSGSYLQLQRLPTVDCGVFRPRIKMKQTFYYSFNELGNKKVYYQVMARGEIIEYGDFDIELQSNDTILTDDTFLPDHQSAMCTNDGVQWDNDIKAPKYVGEFYYFLRLTKVAAPRAHVLLYTVTEDGEVVADSMWYDIDVCFGNSVEMTFGKDTQWPGSDVEIHLKAEPLSLCSLGIVDKSVYVLNKGDLLTESKVSEQLRPLDTSYHTPPLLPTPDYLYCEKNKAGTNNEYVYRSAGYVDAITAFAIGGGIVLTDLEVETRPCKKSSGSDGCFRPPARPLAWSEPEEVKVAAAVLDSDVNSRIGQAGAAGRIPPSEDSPAVSVRANFPETWLFDLHVVGENGQLVLNQTLPDSITEWKGTAVCVNRYKGLAISQPASIVAFQPFFASLTLPYSVVRNETLPVAVTVFNYLKECLPIKLHLDQTEYFSIFNDTLTKELCVCAEQSVTKRFYIKPSKLGQMNVTVTSSTSNEHNICNDLAETITSVQRSDTVTKPVLVEAEGFLKEETTNTYFCLEDEQDAPFRKEQLLTLPDNVIEDSARAHCSFTGDLMGPTLEGLHRLVRLPTGCGEQNMISLVPNIIVLDYLNATGRLTEKMVHKALGNIRHGYSHQQKYRHHDGSYSAFGQYDKQGSMWLTAFVVRTFASAHRYISVNNEELETSKNWILSRQKDNGCFPMVGMVHNQAIKGGLSQNDGTTSALTAYVLISMLESLYINDNVISRSLKCLEAKNKPSNYSLALFSYAASLAKDPSASSYLKQLMDNAETEDGNIYWKDDDRSIAIETAAYAILSLLKLDREGDFQMAALIARWLIAQRNPYGGFYSTQDTVIALQALGEYGARINRQDLDMEVLIKTDQIHEIHQLNEGNELLTRNVNLRLENNLENYVEIEAMGTGCALVQTVLRYNLLTPEPSNDFELSVQIEKSQGNCKKASIRICASYNLANDSNMAIVEVKMVSGYVPNINTLEKLLKQDELEIRRYEIKDNSVNLYFSKLTETIRCASFDVIQEIEVLDTKPANAKVYDYYNNENVVSVPYVIEETCS